MQILAANLLEGGSGFTLKWEVINLSFTQNLCFWTCKREHHIIALVTIPAGLRLGFERGALQGAEKVMQILILRILSIIVSTYLLSLFLQLQISAIQVLPRQIRSGLFLTRKHVVRYGSGQDLLGSWKFACFHKNSLWANPVICLARIENVSSLLRKFSEKSGAMKARRKLLVSWTSILP